MQHGHSDASNKLTLAIRVARSNKLSREMEGSRASKNAARCQALAKGPTLEMRYPRPADMKKCTVSTSLCSLVGPVKVKLGKDATDQLRCQAKLRESLEDTSAQHVKTTRATGPTGCLFKKKQHRPEVEAPEGRLHFLP